MVNPYCWLLRRGVKGHFDIVGQTRRVRGGSPKTAIKTATALGKSRGCAGGINSGGWCAQWDARRDELADWLAGRHRYRVTTVVRRPCFV